MSLDARVYCDCLEKGRLKKPLPTDITIKVDEDGCPLVLKNGEYIYTNDPFWEEFACEHEHHRLVFHALGNIALVRLLRTELEREAGEFPILLGRVVCNGTHCGDWLNLEDIGTLKAELEKLSRFKCAGDLPGTFVARMVEGTFQFEGGDYTSASEADAFMAHFREQMSELVDTALAVRKPISF